VLLSLPLRFRAEQSFLGASDEPFHFAVGSRANRCFLRESVVLTQRQQKGFILCESVVQRSDSNSTDVGHEGVITGRDGFSLRSSIG